MAFRYALGRKTYVVLEVTDVLIDQWDKLKPTFRKKIKQEIVTAIEDDDAGMDMDIEEWGKILKLP